MNTLLSSGHTFRAEHRFPAKAKHEIIGLFIPQAFSNVRAFRSTPSQSYISSLLCIS